MMDLDFGESYTRRMPLYFLVGCGDSMAGEPIRAVEQGIRLLQSELLTQPQAVEQIWLSVITFADTARQVVSLAPVTNFSLPPLSTGGHFNLGAGLRLLIQVIDREVVPTTAERKGDYKPLVFLLFDNEPTDRWERELPTLARAKREKKLGDIVAIGLGERVNPAVLRQITENVLLGAEMTPDSLRSFFRWTSASVTAVSQSVAHTKGSEHVTLPKPPDGYEVVL